MKFQSFFSRGLKITENGEKYSEKGKNFIKPEISALFGLFSANFYFLYGFWGFWTNFGQKRPKFWIFEKNHPFSLYEMTFREIFSLYKK